MQVQATYLIPSFIDSGFSELGEEFKDTVKKITAYITFMYLRWNGHKDEKIHLRAEKLKEISKDYKAAINYLKDQGMISYESGYSAPQGEQKGITRFFLMGNKFLSDIRANRIVKYSGKIFLRQKSAEKSQKRIVEKIEEFKFADDYLAHISKSLERATIDGKKLNNRVTRSKKVGKIWSEVCNLPAEDRKRIKIDGEQTQEWDISASHPRLLVKHNIAANWQERAKLTKALATGNFWNVIKSEIFLLKHLEKEEFKKLFWKSLSAGRVSKDDAAKVEILRQYLAQTFPNMLAEVRRQEQATGDKIQCILQRHEARLMDSFLDFCITNKIPAITIYDGFIVKASDSKKILEFWGNIVNIK